MIGPINKVQFVNVSAIDFGKLQETESKSSKSKSSTEYSFVEKLVNVFNTFSTASSAKIKTLGHSTGEFIASCFSKAITGVSNLYDDLVSFVFNTSNHAESKFYVDNDNSYIDYKDKALDVDYVEKSGRKAKIRNQNIYLGTMLAEEVNRLLPLSDFHAENQNAYESYNAAASNVSLEKDIFKSASSPELHNLSTLSDSRLNLPEKNTFKSYSLPEIHNESMVDRKLTNSEEIALAIKYTREINQLIDKLIEVDSDEKSKLPITEL